ncbi:MAG: hypothetical protein JNK43_10020, partial [Ignavibacteria bacterium]|nr:hypothetical protein [Ignavibacteria bacterium]
MKKFLKITFTLLITIILLRGFTLPLNPPNGNWQQQFLPDIGGRNITDVFFLDSITGWAVTNARNQTNDTIYVLQTINGGGSWSILFAKFQTGGGFPGYFKISFLNELTGYT